MWGSARRSQNGLGPENDQRLVHTMWTRPNRGRVLLGLLCGPLAFERPRRGGGSSAPGLASFHQAL